MPPSQAEEHKPHHAIFSGEVRRYTTQVEYRQLRHITAHLDATVEGFPNLLIAERPAVEAMHENMGPTPKFDVLTLEFDDNDDVKSMGLRADLEGIVRWVLAFPEVRRASVGLSGVLIKVNYDGVALMNSENITVSSICILIPGGGRTSLTVNVVGAYVGDDHHEQGKAHLKGFLKALDKLKDEGLRGVDGLRYADSDCQQTHLLVEYVLVPDGMAETLIAGMSGPASAFPIPNMAVHKDKLGEHVLDTVETVVDLLAELEAAVQLKSDDARRAFAKEHAGVMRENLVGGSSALVTRNDIMHAGFNMWRHELAVMFTISVKTKTAAHFSATLHSYGVYHKVHTVDGVKVFAISNGKYYDLLYQEGLWRDLFQALRAKGQADLADQLTYVGLLTSRTLALANDQRTTARCWVALNINLLTLAAVVTTVFGFYAMKPSQFGFTKKAPLQLLDNRRIERVLCMPQDSLSFVDTNHNGQFEAEHRKSAKSLQSSTRGGGTQGAAFLGPVAKQKMQAGHSGAAQAKLLAATKTSNHDTFAYAQDAGKGFDEVVQHQRTPSKTQHYGGFSLATRSTSRVEDSMMSLLEAAAPAPAPAPATAPAVPPAPVPLVGGPAAVGAGDDDVMMSQRRDDDDDGDAEAESVGTAAPDDDDDVDDDDVDDDVVAACRELGLFVADPDDVVTLEKGVAEGEDEAGPASVTSGVFESICIGDASVPMTPSGAHRKVTTTKNDFCVAFLSPGERLASKLVVALRDVERVHYVKDEKYLAIVVKKDATPRFWVQFETVTRGKAGGTKVDWSKVSGDDPTPDAVASTRRTVVLVGKSAGAFEPLAGLFTKLGTKILRTKLSPPDRALTYDPAAQKATTASRASTSTQQVRTIMCYEYPELTIESCKRYEQQRALCQRGAQQTLTGDKIYDKATGLQWEKYFCSKLKEIRGDLYRNAEEAARPAEPAEPMPMDQD